ncbi:hypothetical protein FRC07_002342 [Ceratobasidium sp. 392]|nr:hypothetical protein FRC07_002342 [Ceratobasidium sp. 392]
MQHTVSYRDLRQEAEPTMEFTSVLWCLKGPSLPPPSTLPNRISWCWTSSDDPSDSSRIPSASTRGCRHTVISAAPRTPGKLILEGAHLGGFNTRLAIVTEEGKLRTYDYDPGRGFAPPSKPYESEERKPGSNEDRDSDSDSDSDDQWYDTKDEFDTSSGSDVGGLSDVADISDAGDDSDVGDGSSVGGGFDTDPDEEHDWGDDLPSTSRKYLSMTEDLRLVQNVLSSWEFYPNETPSGSLKEQIETFLRGTAGSNPPILDDAPLVRIVIISCHHDPNTGKLLSQNFEYPRTHLFKVLTSLPPNVIAIPILSCCFADQIIDEMPDWTKDGALRSHVVLLASSRRDQVSNASFRDGGDHFLNAFFRALKTIRRHKGCQKWEDFLTLVENMLEEERSCRSGPPGGWKEQRPMFVRNTELTPCEVFRGLIGGPDHCHCSLQRGSTRPTVQNLPAQ